TVNLAGSAGDINSLMSKIGPFTASLSTQQRDVHDAVQKILTDVQWALLPDSVKNPTGNFFGGGRGGPGGAGGPGGPGGGGGGGRGGGGRARGGRPRRRSCRSRSSRRARSSGCSPS